MDTRSRKFNWNPLGALVTLALTVLAALVLMGPGDHWAQRQTDRFMSEVLSEYGDYDGVQQAIEAGQGIDIQLPTQPQLTITWGGQTVEIDPDLRVYSEEEGQLPWYIEKGTGRVFSDDGALVTGFIYDYDTGTLRLTQDGSPFTAYSVEPSDEAGITISLPSRREMYANFFALPLLVCAGCTLAAGFVLAMPRRLGMGRGLLGKLPFEWHMTAAILAVAGGVSLAGDLFYTVGDDALPEVLRTLFFLDEPESVRLAQALMLGVFWVGSLCLFEAGASLGMGVRDGLKQYLLCRVWTVRFLVWIWRGLRALGHRLLAVDFSKSVEGTLIKVLGINLVVMIGCCALWSLGAAAAVLYTGVAFFVLRRLLRRLQQQYIAVRDSVGRMAAGELRAPMAQLPEDSPLAPVARDLDAVRQGFGKALAREMRSQNMKTELITNVSHDLKTPLTAIITYVDLLKDDSLTADQRRAYVDTLDRKSQRLKRLIDDLFEVSKAATGNVELHKEPVELGSLLRQVQFELDDQLSQSKVEFRWQLPPSGQRLPAVLDGQRTCRIFENLLINITKYALPGTRAYVCLERQGDMAVVTMKNVSAAELNFSPDEITERFVRGDKNRSTEGSGLGLAIARSFTELQGGSFAVETDGDLFKAIVRLPLENRVPSPTCEVADEGV